MSLGIINIILPLGMLLVVPAGVLLHGVDGVRCPGHHGPLFFRRLRQHRRLHLRDDAQISAKHVRRLPGKNFSRLSEFYLLTLTAVL